MLVYKYFYPDRIDVLENGSIRFSQPVALNDPFESLPDFTGFANQLKTDMISQYVQRSGGAISDTIRAEIESTIDAEVANIPSRLGDANILLCLTKQRNNLLMWAHYASSHQGFVIGFDSENDFFKPGDGIGLMGMKEVKYSPERPVVPNGGLESMSSTDGLIMMFYTKSIGWAYEEELRIIADPNAATQTLPGPNGVDLCLYNFPPDCVKEVIVGYRMPDAGKQRISDLLKSKYPSVALFQAHLNPHKFELDIMPMVP